MKHRHKLAKIRINQCYKKSKIPKKMKWLFWSYDINSLDLNKDKNYIITQTLNYGTWEDIQWLFRIYSEKEIVKIIKNPPRSQWFEKVLNFWLTIFDIKLKKNIYQKALINLQKLTA